MANIKNSANDRLPVFKIMSLTLTGFIAIMTETIPVGLLSQISSGLNISPSMAGQFVSVYAAGSFLTAIPVMAATRSVNRKVLLLIAVVGFLIMNTLTALVSSMSVILVARFGAGVAAGVSWGLLTGFTLRFATPSSQGKALALMGIGQPVALAFGVPATAFLSKFLPWQSIFLMISAISFLMFLWLLYSLPSVPGEPETRQRKFYAVLLNKKILAVMAILFFWIMAHSALFTFISPLLASAGLFHQLDLFLFMYGMSSVAGIILTGVFADRFPNAITYLAISLFILSGVIITAGHSLPSYTFGIVVWGVAMGGAPTLLVNFMARYAGNDVDLAQSCFVTTFNMAIAGGGALGGVVASRAGIHFVPLCLIAGASLALLVFALNIGRDNNGK